MRDRLALEGVHLVPRCRRDPRELVMVGASVRTMQGPTGPRLDAIQWHEDQLLVRDIMREVSGVPSERRAARAIERQLAYQAAKADALRGDSAELVAWCERRTAGLRARLCRLHVIDAATRVLEVGSGAHGHVFFLGGCDAVGVDPLADEYRALFEWQTRARTVAAYGESLPFERASFDVVISDNVVDHAAAPARILSEIVRVLRPGGILYFTVNVHHPFWDFASRLHGALSALGAPMELAPFADHTVHLTARAARRLLARPELSIIQECVDDSVARDAAKRPRHAGDLVKQVFVKNAVLEVVARRR